jgi:hypothetical protein
MQCMHAWNVKNIPYRLYSCAPRKEGSQHQNGVITAASGVGGGGGGGGFSK